MIRKTVYTKEPRYGVMEALRLVLLFHSGEPWTPGRRAEWLEIAGTEEATTKTLCDHVRAALAIGARCPEENSDDDAFFRLYGLKAGHTLTADNERDIQTVLGDYNDELTESTEAFYRIRMETIREIGGQELVEAVTANDNAFRNRLVEKALKMIREKWGGKSERDELYGYVQGLIGLTQLIRTRDDVTPELANVLRTSHRVVDAAAYLTQINPPEEPQ